MAQSDSAASSYTVVLLEKNVPPISKNTDEQTRQKVLIPLGYNEGRLTNIMSASYVGGRKGVRPGAVYKLYGRKDVTKLKSVKLLYHMTMYNSENIEISSTLEIANAFTEAKNGYQHCKLKFSKTESYKTVRGPSATVEAFCDYLNEQSAMLLLSASTNPLTPDKTIDDSVHAATAMPLTTTPQSVYDNMSPDALALLEKLPIGQIDGVYYNPTAGKVFIDKESAEKEDERITKFQTAYQSILSRKVKTIKVPIPATVSPDALANRIHQYNQTYDQCVFSVQEGEFPCVKIVSTSSRQHDQARTLLTEELVKMVSLILPAVSECKCEIIQLSKTRTLTLKKANIVEEDVDFIVNPANESLAHGGGVAAALNNASQGQLQTFSNRYTKKKGKVPVGNIAITGGGGALKCDKVIHAVGPDTRYGEAECERLLTQVITEALKGAEKYNANSISFPAISTGIFGVKKELVARCLVDTIMAHHLTKPHPVLSDIRIVIIDEKTYAPFAQCFQQKMASLEIGSNSHRSLIQPAKFKAPASTLTSPPPVADATDKGTQLVAPEPAAPPDMTLSWIKDSSTILSLLEGLADNWYALGSLLGFSKSVLDRINSIQDDPKVYLDRIVTKWLLSDATSSPTVSALVNTLSGIEGTEQIVQSILEEYGEQNAKQFKHQTSQEEAPDVSAIKYPGPNDMPDTTADTSDVSLADSSGNGPTDSLTTTTAGTTMNTGAPTSSSTNNTTDQLPSSTSAPSMLVNTNVNGMTTPTTHPLQPGVSVPPGFPSQSSIPTPGGYNNGQIWRYPTTQGGSAQLPVAGGSQGLTTTAFTSGVMATGMHQNSTLNQPRPRGITPHLVAQRSPYPDGMMNPQHGEGDPRHAGVGTVNGGHGATGMNFSPGPAVSGSGSTHGATGMNFSPGPAVSGSGSEQDQDIGGAITAQPHSNTHQTGQDNSGTKNSKGTSQTKEDSAKCPICLSGFKDPMKTKCGHSFCRGCINEALQHSPYCPSCKTAIRKIVGNQPNGGKMTVKYSKSKLPGYYDCGTIEIHYDIRDGTQSKLHPHPGRKFQGAYRVAYLPNNFEGNEVLQLLKRAFDARLTFTVGTSITSGQNDVVTWNDIHHKTSTHGGPYGYPDSTYLARVKADLAAKGIVTVDSTAV